MLYGWNSWQAGSAEQQLRPTSLWRGEDIDWWAVPLAVPDDATDLSFVLTNGHGTFDNNSGNNYVCQVGAKRCERNVEGVVARVWEPYARVGEEVGRAGGKAGRARVEG